MGKVIVKGLVWGASAAASMLVTLYGFTRAKGYVANRKGRKNESAPTVKKAQRSHAARPTRKSAGAAVRKAA